MISTYTPLPLLTGSASADPAPPASPDTPRDLDAPSFQSRLDQQNDLRRAQRFADAPPHPQSVTRRDDDTDEAADAAHDDADSHASPAASSKDSAAATHSDDKEDDKKAKAKHTAHQNAQAAATALPSTSPTPPFTPATLALAGGIAPVPAPLAPAAAPAPAEQNAVPEPVVAAPALVPSPSATSQANDALQAVAPLSTNTPLPLLNLPGVSMDSNAASKTAASRVADALPQAAAPAAAPAGLSLPAPPAPANTDTLANASAVQTVSAVGAQNADPSSVAPLSLAAPAEGATAAVTPAVVLPLVATSDSAAANRFARSGSAWCCHRRGRHAYGYCARRCCACRVAPGQQHRAANQRDDCANCRAYCQRVRFVNVQAVCCCGHGSYSSAHRRNGSCRQSRRKCGCKRGEQGTEPGWH